MTVGSNPSHGKGCDGHFERPWQRSLISVNEKCLYDADHSMVEQPEQIQSAVQWGITPEVFQKKHLFPASGY